MNVNLIEQIRNMEDKLVQDMIYLGITFVISLALFAFTFSNDLSRAIRITIILYWLYVLPGFSILMYFRESIGFIERFVAGSILGGILMGVFGYFIGLIFKINIIYYPYFLPPMIIAAGFLIVKYVKK